MSQLLEFVCCHDREAGPSRSTMARLVHTPMLK